MSLDGFYKRNIYWIQDFLHGSRVGKHYREIKTIMKSAETGKKIQSDRLNDLLKHAIENTVFYKSYAGRTLEQFPVMNKSKLIENYDDIVVPIEKIPGQETEKVHVQKTSGSTGTPFAIYQDSRKHHRRVAELKYFGQLVGFKSHEKLAQCRIWTNWQSKTKSQIFKENIFLINVSKMDDKTLKELCSTVKKNKIVAIRAYASWYDSLLAFLIQIKEI